MSDELVARRTHDDSLCILWDGVAPHIRYLGAVYRDECPRGVLRGKPEEIVECFGPGSRERFRRALQYFMVDHPRRCQCREGGEEDNYAAQHVGGAERWKGKMEDPSRPSDPSHIYKRFM
jgi:hypothetical protein